MASHYRSEGDADQLDVAKYAAVVARQWKLVLAITLLAVIAAVVATMVLAQVAPRYQSQVTVLLTGPRYKIAFDPRFTNVDSATAPSATRADEYRAIAASPEVREAALKAVADQIPPENLRNISMGILVRGALLTALGSADDRDRAVLVGNAYANAVAARLDAVYGQTEQDRQALARQLDETIAAHQKAQDELTAFTRDSRIDALGIQIAQKEAVMQSLAEERTSSIKNRLAGYYGTLTEADQIVRAATTLRDQVQTAANASTPATGASLSLATLQSRLATVGTQSDEAHIDLSRDSSTRRGQSGQSGQGGQSGQSGSDRTPSALTGSRVVSSPQLQLQLNADALARADADPKALLTSIDAVIASARAQQDDIRRSIDVLSQQVASGGNAQEGSTLDATINQLAGELTALQADYRQQTFRRDVLTQNVEQARSTRSTLEAKLSEADVAAGAIGGGALVVGGGSADQIWPPSLSRSVLIAAIAGLAIGILAALASNWTSTRRAARARPTESPSPAPAALAR